MGGIRPSIPMTIWTDVEDAYGVTPAAYLAARSYFAQVPYPSDLKVGAWFVAGAMGHVVGGTGQTGATQLTALKALGSSAFVIGGQSVTVDLNVTGTGTTGYTAIATAIQTAIQAIAAPDLSAATCTYDAIPGAYRVAITVGVTISGPMSGAGAVAVGLSGAGSRYLPGVPVETVGQALSRIDTIDSGWYWVVPAPSIATDATNALALGTWVNGHDKQTIIDQSGDAVLVANETTSIAAQLSAQASDRVSVLWSNTADFKAASAAARLSSVDFEAFESLPVLFGKNLPGRVPDNIGLQVQVDELDRKRLNYYVSVGGTNIVRPGQTVAPRWWIDTRFWLDWLIDRIRRDLFHLLTTVPRIPLTPRGLGRIQATVEAVCEAGRFNGGIFPGRVSEATSNDIRRTTGSAFDGFLGRGYLVYVTPVVTEAQRTARQAPPTTVWLRGSGAVNFLEVTLTFSE